MFSKNAFIGGIKIYDEIIAFMPNHSQSKINNKLVFFDSIKQKFMNDILFDIVSFQLLENNFPIMKISKY